ncbi:MAG: peptidylprolyl isomerase [Solirubrobacterales bacterium]|nr:peptidylprolyl isomerase [Solirubrobacterales bacterium]
MRKKVRLIPARGAVLFALVGLAACGGSGGIPANAVVSVGGTPITKPAFKHWMQIAAVSGASGVFAKNPVAPDPPAYTACIAHFKEISENKKLTAEQLKRQCESQYKSLLQQVLGFLISSQWVIGEANSLGVKVSDKEVKKQFETIKAQQFPKAAEFEKFLTTSGQSVSDLLLRVKLNLLSTKIQQKILKEKTKVSQAQIDKYYNENKSRYNSPEKRNVLIIQVKTEAQAKAAKKEIESGKTFASVAKRVSIDPASKVAGGALNEVQKGQEPAGLDQALFAAAANKLSGPVKTAFGYYIYEVKTVTPATQQSLAQAQQSIKAQLNATQQRAVLAKFVKEFKDRWKAKTDCRSAFVVANCKQYKAPKTGTTSTAAP